MRKKLESEKKMGIITTNIASFIVTKTIWLIMFNLISLKAESKSIDLPCTPLMNYKFLATTKFNVTNFKCKNLKSIQFNFNVGKALP